jgi:hypothetical protein
MDIFEGLDLTDSSGQSGAPPLPVPVVPADFDFISEYLENTDEDNAEISNLNLSCDDEPEWCEGCKKLKQVISIPIPSMRHRTAGLSHPASLSLGHIRLCS